MDAFMEEFQYLKIQLEAIRFATNNFDENNLIGTGGFGRVYKGEITHSKGRSMVAFKRLDPRYGQGNPEFWKEIMMLSLYEHENIISLLGFCDESGEKILVYEYASRGSLDHLLSLISLTWSQRLKICLDVAKALQYLHDPKGTQQRVLHRDLKSSNILLDKKGTAKVSDFGLSKSGPANQRHTFLISNAVGTLGYCDPLYMEQGYLTKESDVYSLGVVFFEVLCGRLCFESHNGHILVPMWKQSYELKKLDEIIFQGLKKQIDPRCLETFSKVAYLCLSRSQVERPTISHVVKELEISLKFQEVYEVIKQPNGYEEIINAATPPLIYGSVKELRMLLSKGIFLNHGQTWFSINKAGERCLIISAKGCLIPTTSGSKNRYSLRRDSRFSRGCYLAYDGKFKTYVKTQFLLPQTTYTINLVFKFIYKRSTVRKPAYSALKYRLEGDTKPLISYFADEREDGWLMTELYQITSETRYVNFKIVFEGSYSMVVEGIEFRTMEKVKQEVLENKKIAASESDIYRNHRLLKVYEEMIMWSKESVQWTTEWELSYILGKGFRINDGKEWLSLDEAGKKCHMLSARKVLLEQECSWEPLAESRFEEVAVHPNKRFSIVCKTKTQVLSPQTRYASYLVYKLPKDPYEFEAPMIMNYKGASRFINFLSPRTPTFRPKVGENTYNPLSRPKMSGRPRMRHDGWMEVPLWPFVTGVTPNMVSMC